jgi:transposase
MLQNFQIHRSTIYRAKKKLRETGTLDPDYQNNGRPCSLPWQAVRHISWLVGRNPLITLNQIVDNLRIAGFNTSISTVHRELRRLGLTFKKSSKRAQERNEQLRALFQYRMSKYRSEQLIFLDESYKDDRTVIRGYGWGRRGTRSQVTAPFVRGARYVCSSICSFGN